MEVVNIDYHPDFFIAICGDIPFVLFLQLARKICEMFRAFVLLLVLDDDVIYGGKPLEVLLFGNSSASYDKITLLACPVETCGLATMHGSLASSPSVIVSIHDLCEHGMETGVRCGAIYTIEVVLADVFFLSNTKFRYREEFRGAVFVFLHKPYLIGLQ